MNSLKELIVKELVEHVICNGVSIVNDELAYVFQGFAKSGEGTLFEKDGKLYLKTRYNQIDEVNSVEDVAYIAYSWDKIYQDYYGFDSNWLYFYKKFGWVETKEVTTTVVTTLK